jgi:hypothetical protein
MSIFGATTIPTALSLGKNILTIGNGNYKLAVNQLSYSYNRSVTPYYTLNAADIGKILVTGEPVGQLTLSYLMGASKNLVNFLDNFSDVCNISNNSISLTIGNEGCKGVELDLDIEHISFLGCLITGVGGTLSRSQNGNLCIGNVQLLFTELKMS